MTIYSLWAASELQSLSSNSHGSSEPLAVSALSCFIFSSEIPHFQPVSGTPQRPVCVRVCFTSLGNYISFISLEKGKIYDDEQLLFF